MSGRRARAWAAWAAVALVTACGGSPTSVDAGEIEGRWEWRSASGGIAGRTITPQTEGYTMELRVADDEVALYKNGALQKAARYRLALGREGGSFAGKDVVVFTPSLFGWEEMGLQLSVEGELILADGCCDGFTYTWARAGGAQ